MNLGGATDRPDLERVWENVQAQLKGEKERHTEIKRFQFMDLIREVGFLGLLRFKFTGKF